MQEDTGNIGKIIKRITDYWVFKVNFSNAHPNIFLKKK
jgi:hypothetical protein